MTANGWLQFLLYFVVLVILMRPLGIYMARVFEGQHTFLDPVFKPIERLLYRLFGMKEDEEMDWREYTAAMLLFSFANQKAMNVTAGHSHGYNHRVRPHG